MNQCQNCLYWKRRREWVVPDDKRDERGYPVFPSKEQSSKSGDCRRFPPSAGCGNYGSSTDWPATREDEWCGEWKEIEETGLYLLACGKCQNPFISIRSSHRPEFKWAGCEKCQLVGPIERSLEDAVRAWNRMIQLNSSRQGKM